MYSVDARPFTITRKCNLLQLQKESTLFTPEHEKMAKKSFFRRNSSKKPADGVSGEINGGITSLPNHIEKLEKHRESSKKSEEFYNQRRRSTKDEAVWYQNGKFIKL